MRIAILCNMQFQIQSFFQMHSMNHHSWNRYIIKSNENYVIIIHPNHIMTFTILFQQHNLKTTPTLTQIQKNKLPILKISISFKIYDVKIEPRRSSLEFVLRLSRGNQSCELTPRVTKFRTPRQFAHAWMPSSDERWNLSWKNNPFLWEFFAGIRACPSRGKFRRKNKLSPWKEFVMRLSLFVQLFFAYFLC